MVQPDGHASLAVRKRFLRQQRRRARRFGDRGMIAIWVGVSTLAAWAVIAGVAGLSR